VNLGYPAWKLGLPSTLLSSVARTLSAGYGVGASCMHVLSPLIKLWPNCLLTSALPPLARPHSPVHPAFPSPEQPAAKSDPGQLPREKGRPHWDNGCGHKGWKWLWSSTDLLGDSGRSLSIRVYGFPFIKWTCLHPAQLHCPSRAV
jgi:hypothetical protein